MKFTCHTLIKRETLLFFAIAPALLSAADKVVKVSNFKPDRANATVAVQHAIDAGAKTVIFDNPGFDYLVGPITLRSDRELIFEDGVHVRALPGGFKDRNACLFKGSGVKNVVMRGRGNAVLSMNKRDYQNPKLYDLGEWRHTVSLFGCRNVTIKDLTIRSSGGDGVYIAKGKRPLMENNILLENLLLDDHHRQGVSVISVNGLVIRKCRIQNTNGTPPMCGIDFEPNNASEEVSNCLIEETEFLNNATAGISFYCKHLKKPLNVTIRNCRITGIEGISISDVDAGTIRFENCKIVDCKLPIIIRNKRSGVATSFSGCEIDNRSGKADIPIRIFTEFRENCGGIDFGKFLIRQTPERKIMTFEAVRGAGLDLPAGEITVINSGEKNSVFDLRKFAKGHRPNPELLNFKTSPVRLTDYIPIQRKGQRKGHTFSIRRAVFFVQYCDGKNPVKLRFKTAWKRKKTAMSPMQLEIFCPAGTSNGTVAIDKDDFTYELKGSRGVYRFRLKTGGRAVNIESSAPGFGFEADSKLRLLGSTGTFYFYVPANVTTFAVQFQGEIGEAVEAELVDPSGKVRSTIRCEADAQILKGERPENSPAEIWSIRIPYAKDDYSIRLGAPLPPILYTVPENVLVPKK